MEWASEAYTDQGAMGWGLGRPSQTSPALNATCHSLINPKIGCIQAHHTPPDLRNKVRIIHPPPHRTYPSYRVVRTEQDPTGA